MYQLETPAEYRRRRIGGTITRAARRLDRRATDCARRGDTDGSPAMWQAWRLLRTLHEEKNR